MSSPDKEGESGSRAVRPYGSWKSPITADDLFAKFTGIQSVQIDGEYLYWRESRPDGRTVIVRRAPDGAVSDVTLPDYDVRTRVHEYGGGDYLVADRVVYFANLADQRWYRQVPGSNPEPLTRVEGMRYADPVVDRARARLVAIREDHTTGSPQPVNTIIAIDLEGSREDQVLVSGNDFYSTPRLSPDGARLAWLTWNHPNMPWDGTELWVAELRPDGLIGQATRVAGGETESIFQPEWSPDGVLYFVSDRTGWWNLYRWRDGAIEPLHPMEAEFGEPQWEFAQSTYAFLSPEKLACIYTSSGCYHLAVLNTRSLAFQEVELPVTTLFELHADPPKVLFLGGSSGEPLALMRVDVATGEMEIVRRIREVTIDRAYFSLAQPIEFPTDDGATAYGLLYAPNNPEFAAPQDERPPLLVMSHGGPTGASTSSLRYGIQYWTTRGVSVLDVNYGGSTGYGRAYRERLKGQWGIVDVADCVNGARYLAAQGLVDPNRLAITGGSAGGFTTLCALTFHDTFSAGASYFGVSDLEALAKETHKFESRYLDGLVGPYPERRDLYVERSPIHHTEQLACPMILLQGLDDPVVPPNQSQMMYDAVRARHLPVAYLSFPGEQHGFLKAENNKRALEAELYFYSRVFGFDLADVIDPCDIENLDRAGR